MVMAWLWLVVVVMGHHLLHLCNFHLWADPPRYPTLRPWAAPTPSSIFGSACPLALLVPCSWMVGRNYINLEVKKKTTSQRFLNNIQEVVFFVKKIQFNVPSCAIASQNCAYCAIFVVIEVVFFTHTHSTAVVFLKQLLGSFFHWRLAVMASRFQCFVLLFLAKVRSPPVASFLLGVRVFGCLAFVLACPCLQHVLYHDAVYFLEIVFHDLHQICPLWSFCRDDKLFRLDACKAYMCFVYRAHRDAHVSCQLWLLVYSFFGNRTWRDTIDTGQEPAKLLEFLLSWILSDNKQGRMMCNWLVGLEPNSCQNKVLYTWLKAVYDSRSHQNKETKDKWQKWRKDGRPSPTDVIFFVMDVLVNGLVDEVLILFLPWDRWLPCRSLLRFIWAVPIS